MVNLMRVYGNPTAVVVTVNLADCRLSELVDFKNFYRNCLKRFGLTHAGVYEQGGKILTCPILSKHN